MGTVPLTTQRRPSHTVRAAKLTAMAAARHAPAHFLPPPRVMRHMLTAKAAMPISRLNTNSTVANGKLLYTSSALAR